MPNQSLFQPGFCRETSWEGPFSRMVFFHGELYIKKRNHSLCLLSLRGSYKDGLFVMYWKDCCFAALTGKDVATSVEVFWPDGHSVARALEPSDMNKVMEIYYLRMRKRRPKWWRSRYVPYLSCSSVLLYLRGLIVVQMLFLFTVWTRIWGQWKWPLHW